MMIATMTTPSSSITTSSRRIPSLFLALPNCHNQPFSPPLIRKKFTFSSSTNQLKQLLEHHHHRHHPLSHISHRHLQKKKPTTSIIIIKASSSSMESSAASSAESQAKSFSVLFVCWGNICRSPAAEGVFRDLVKKRDLDSNFKIDSAGTINYHEGNLADPRMRAASKKRGIEITSISRPIRPSDFRDFDIILAMDKQNREDILEAFNRWKFREPLPDDAHKKVKLMCSYCKKHDETEVPDPYYGGPQGFEKVLDLLQDACESLLDSILAENSG